MNTDEDELITIDEACREIGGKTKPISKPTFYRGCKLGLYGPIIHPSPGTARLWLNKLRKDIRARAEAPRRSTSEDKPPPPEAAE